jgi:hypothetical protein
MEARCRMQLPAEDGRLWPPSGVLLEGVEGVVRAGIGSGLTVRCSR